jgi:hypothetical protein
MDEGKRLISYFSHSELLTIGTTVISGWCNESPVKYDLWYIIGSTVKPIIIN